MRNFDSWNRYKDNNNQPLHGCVMFNVKDGNTVAPIFDSDGTPLDNPILTDNYGRTQHQVFVNEDVVAYFYKYIGTGSYNTQQDIDISDDSKWSLQYTSENILETNFSIVSDSAMCVNSIEDLRALDIEGVPEVSGVKVITLLGYNECGDKEPINYIWNAQSEDADDNGSIIQSDNQRTGRWKMVKPTEHCDSRHFGIFPSNTINFVGNTARIEQWLTYCNVACLRPYFSSNGDYKYYRYNNLAITNPVIDVAPNVTFLDTGTANNWSCEINGNPYFYNHSTNLASKLVKSSWGAYNFINPEHVIIDNEDTMYCLGLANCVVDCNVSCNKPYTFNKCTVNINKSFSGISGFTSCIINSKNQITSGCHFSNCKLTEDMFYGSPYVHCDGNCIADFNDFEHKLLMWKRIQSQIGRLNYDWQGLITTEAPWEDAIDSDRWLLNWKCTSTTNALVEHTNPHTYFIENCAGTITLQGKAANTYVFKDSEINVKFATGYNEGCTIVARNSTINIDQSIKLASLNTQDSSIGGSGDIDTTYSYNYNSVITINIHCGYADIKDSNISSTVQIYGIDQTDEIIVDPTPEVTATHTQWHVHRIIAGTIVNNYVNGNIEIGTIDYTNDPHYTAVDLVRGLTITDNIGLSTEPITVHVSFSSMYDNYNIYVYKNNSGSMAFNNSVVAPVQYPVTTCAVTPMNSNQGAYIYNADPEYYACQARFFTIGTVNVKVKAHTIVNTMARGLGASGGLNVFLTDSVAGETNYPSFKKTYGVPFMWDIQNMPVCAGLFDFNLAGDELYFDIDQD